MTCYVIDIDGTICTNTHGEYKEANPFYERIKYVNQLYSQGHEIKFFTARGSGTGIDWREVTKTQLKKWGVKYHELRLGKPEGDIFIDDKAFNSEDWKWQFKKDASEDSASESFEEIDNLLVSQKNIIDLILEDINFKKKLIRITSDVKNSLKNSGKIIFAGNGGSFSDAQHLAAEFVSRFATDRSPLPSIALGTNSSNLTAIGNDFGFEKIFSREFQAIAKPNDLLFAISTSGNSTNIIELVKKAKEMSIKFYIFTGKDGGKLSKYDSQCVNIPSGNTAIIQQTHITIGHIIVGLAEKDFLDKD